MQPVEILMDLVIKDELDPWDIDIEDIANRFIEEVKKMVKLNLRLSGKTILASSILLRMKSDSLVPKEEPEFDEDLGWDYFPEESADEIMPLETPVRRRGERKTTLFELIDALQKALNEEMIRKNFPKGARPKPKMVIPLDEETVRERMTKILDKLNKLQEHTEVIKFSDLLSKKREDIIVVLVALLHLDAQRQVNIWQEEFFDEIFITLN